MVKKRAPGHFGGYGSCNKVRETKECPHVAIHSFTLGRTQVVAKVAPIIGRPRRQMEDRRRRPRQLRAVERRVPSRARSARGAVARCGPRLSPRRGSLVAAAGTP